MSRFRTRINGKSPIFTETIDIDVSLTCEYAVSGACNVVCRCCTIGAYRQGPQVVNQVRAAQVVLL